MELSDKAKEALSKAIESSANALADTLDSSGKLVKDNVKELAAEVIVYEGYFKPAISIACSIIAQALIYRAYAWLSAFRAAELERRADYGTDAGLALFGIAICYGVFFITIICILSELQTMVKAKFTKRLFLTEQSVKLIRALKFKSSGS